MASQISEKHYLEKLPDLHDFEVLSFDGCIFLILISSTHTIFPVSKWMNFDSENFGVAA